MWSVSLSSKSGKQSTDLVHTNPVVGTLLGAKSPEKTDYLCFEELRLGETNTNISFQNNVVN